MLALLCLIPCRALAAAASLARLPYVHPHTPPFHECSSRNTSRVFTQGSRCHARAVTGTGQAGTGRKMRSKRDQEPQNARRCQEKAQRCRRTRTNSNAKQSLIFLSGTHPKTQKRPAENQRSSSPGPDPLPLRREPLSPEWRPEGQESQRLLAGPRELIG